jgi:hypothetical protein
MSLSADRGIGSYGHAVVIDDFLAPGSRLSSEASGCNAET